MLFLNSFFPLEIEDSLVIGQQWKDDVRVILFVVMKPNQQLTSDLKGRITKKIRERLSPRHSPSKIIKVPDIPYTITNKKVEIVVRKIIMGEVVQNRSSLRNPESLDFFKNIPELQTDELQAKL